MEDQEDKKLKSLENFKIYADYTRKSELFKSEFAVFYLSRILFNWAIDFKLFKSFV